MSTDKPKGIPKSRTSSLFSMAAKIALKEGKTLLQNSTEKRLAKMMSQADIVVKHVGQLKGAAMKAVQMISIEAQDLLPPEVIAILEKLQSQAPPLPNDLMIKSIRDELGDELFSKLENLSTDPIASASIGQVYEACFEGKPVVVKVQYPDIATSIDSDLNTLKKLISTLNFITNKKINLDEIFSEVKRILIQETNYKNEAKLLKLYKNGFESSHDYTIPSVFEEFSTERIIVLSKEEGIEISQWINSYPNQESKERIGSLLLNLYMKEFFDNQLVQTDPNPANFLVTEDLKLVLLDFGATISYSDKFVQEYRALIRSVFLEDKESLLQTILKLNLISEKESKEAQSAFVDFLKLSVHPFSEDLQPFDFSQSEYSDEVRKSALVFTRLLKYSPPPKELIFLHRKLGGLFQLLRKLAITADLSEFRHRVLS